MRNLIENHIEEFAEILRYDKLLWPKVWKQLKKRFSPILDELEKSIGEVKFSDIERRELDRFIQNFNEFIKVRKEKLAERIRKNSREFELYKEDFIIFLGFAPTEFDFDWIVVKGKKENVIFLNVFSIWKRGELDNLEDVIYQSVVHYRHSEKKGIYYNKEKIFEAVLVKLKSISKNEPKVFMKNVCDLLYNKIPYYDWVGFYMLNDENLLELEEFTGEPTEHVKIPVGKGICGQAVEKMATFIVQDVSKETNYLACSPKVKSEIVVPIFLGKEIIGEIDIDSHYIAPFDERDEKFLKKICEEVSKIWKMNLNEE
ncbi:GAF domain-containing protein [Thermosipho atlanticus]|uniref:GAF domain-containing protein n=1 Tax=Thermosipho atlanticus DSM 15807 TaxID=1123380 RepID=A0A1M5QYX6_9BACT|nr:GAF domain-containing protein [Thermosipho atlanticus]SHH19108.1 GAF domain-containing protein [Thermosipho atlanticus DSM 15807]